jgi:monoterpene epsilon-lactone hydrolase
MTEPNQGPRGVSVPARVIPPPPTVSPAAQARLSPATTQERPAQPPIDDKAAWRAHLEAGNRDLTAMLAPAAQAFPTEVAAHDLSASKVFELVPKSLSPASENAAILYVHGGAFVLGGGQAAAYMAMPLAGLTGIRTFSVDYRMPPDHPFPAGLDDVVEAYEFLLKRYAADRIVVVGPSAGGGLAAAFLLKARDLGMPTPRACVLPTPEVDLTESGDTFETNALIDVVLRGRLTESIALYADGHDLRDPYLSPIFGDFGKGFPPTLLLSGTRDLFLSNTVILHRALLRAGVEAELHVWEGMPHAGFSGAPEDQEVLAEQVRFIKARLGVAPGA